MSTDPLQHRYKVAIDRYQAAESLHDIREVLNELTAILHESLGQPFHRTALFIRAKCMQSLGQLQKSEDELRQLIDDVEPALDKEGPAFLCALKVSLAEVLSLAGMWKEAINFFYAAALLFRQSGDWQSEVNVLRRIGQLWQDHDNLNRAITVLETAMSVLEGHELTPIHLGILHTLGHCYYLSGNYEAAIELQEQALKLARHSGDTEAENGLIHNLAEFTFGIQDFRRALHYVSKRLRLARAQKNLEDISRYLSYLGACLTETGQSNKALDNFDKLNEHLAKQGEQESVLSGMCLNGKVQALVDMKRYDEARPLLARARTIFLQNNIDTALLDENQRRLERETGAPLTVDCAHRVLQMALAGSSQKLTHSNPQPSVDLGDDRFLTSKLTEEGRAQLSGLYQKLNEDILQTKYAESQRGDLPGSFILPLHFEFVDDVEQFEIKWAAYKREREATKQRATLQQEWERSKDRFAFQDGVFHGDNVELLEYLQRLARLAMLYAEIEDRETVREITLHAADFVEMHTDDPMIAAAVWPIRAELMLAAHPVSEPRSRELVEIELRHSLKRAGETFELLDKERLSVALDLSLEIWFDAASKVLGDEGYSSLVKAVGDRVDFLKPTNKFRYGIAVGEIGDPAKSVRIMDAVISEECGRTPHGQVFLAPEFQIGLAKNRFKALCPDRDACVQHYGPFAPYVHQEVLTWSPDTHRADTNQGPTNLTRPPVLGFTDGNLVVMAKTLGFGRYGDVATIMHEIDHQLFRAGQQKKTEDGKWLFVKRDVPIASALTYLRILSAEKNEGSTFTSKIQELVSMGLRHAEAEPEATHAHIDAMLRYFDDLGTQETPASYPCAAILLGVAFGLLGQEQVDKVSSYLCHLALMNHRNALSYGRREATLQL